MNFLKRKKKLKKVNDLGVKNDEEINSLLDSTKLAATLSLRSTTHKLNFFFDDSDIFRAVVKGDKDFFYLSRTHKKKIYDFRYMTGNCFHLAVKYFQKDICQILVNIYGFDPKQSCSLGCTPLHWIMSTSHTKLFRKEDSKSKFRTTIDYLIAKRVDPNAKDNEGMTALHYAAKTNNDYGTERLLKEWSLRIDEMDNLKQTAIHLACRYGSDRVFKVLIESERMKLEYFTNPAYEYLPLHHACRASIENCDIVESMIKKILELKLNKLLRTHMNVSIRKKLIVKLMPILLSRLEFSSSPNSATNTFTGSSIMNDGGIFSNPNLTPQPNANHQNGGANNGFFPNDEPFNQREFILNKFEFIRIIDETNYFLKELINRKDSGENRPLHLAVEQNYLNLVSLLFKYGAMSILHSSNRNLPIHIAAKNGSTDMFDLLEQHNSISFKSNLDMENLFHICVANNNVSFLKIACDYFSRNYQMLKHSKDFKYAFDSVNSNFLTPLFLAASKSNTECVRILVEMRPHAKFYLDDYSRNIFHICSLFNSSSTFKYLIDDIEQTRKKLSRTDLSQTNLTNLTQTASPKRVKFVAVEEEDQESDQQIDKMKLEKIREIDEVNSKDEDDENDEDDNDLLSKHHQLIDDQNDLIEFENQMYATDSNGNNILHLSAFKRSIKVLNLIFFQVLENHISLARLFRKKNLQGETFFQIACNTGCIEIVELVLKNRAQMLHNYNPVNDHDNNLNTPLLSSIIYNQCNSVRLLIEYGADLKCENLKKQTPLHLSCMIGSYEITEFLIRMGANLNVQDMFNMNPLAYACKNGNAELVKLLLDTEESIFLVTPQCLNISIEFNNTNIVELLFNNKNWSKMIDVSFENNGQQIKNLIEKMPDKMETLLDKCFDLKTEKYNFRYLDHRIVNTIENHPLYLITESNDERLITHHTTRKLLKLKSSTFPRIAFILDLILYLLFVFFCTTYHLTSWKFKTVKTYGDLIASHLADLDDDFDATSLNETFLEELVPDKYVNQTYLIYHLKIIDLEIEPALFYINYTILLSVVLIHLSKEIFQLISYSFVDYFSSVDNWFQLTALIITIISLIPALDYKLRIAIGSFSILYSWICLSLFFQDLELFSLGRYIVAFRKTIQNSFKFLPFFTMICLGFFFCFKVGERFNQDDNDNTIANETLVSASSNFIRIISMMVGELDISTIDTNLSLSDFFKLENLYNTGMFVFFVFMMCIIVLSLFEGIAVGEVKAVLDKAHIEIIASNIIYVLKIQKLSYTIYRFLKKKEPTFMNVTEFHVGKDISARIEQERKKSTDPVLRIENSLVLLSFNMNSLSRQLEEQTQQIRYIKKKVDI